MILGHNARSVDTGYKIVHTTGALATPMDSLVNGGVQGEIDTQWHGQSNVPYMNPGYDGWSLWTLSSTITQFHVVSTDEHNVGSIITGRYYDMPHSPDLKLTMTRKMDGVKRIRTKGGNDLADHKYIKPVMWGSAGAWELWDNSSVNHKFSRSGRRVWDLSFSYLQDSDVFPMLSSINPYESVSNTGAVYSSSYTDEEGVEVPETTWHNSETLLDDNTFYSQVIHKTNGGQLRFLFQPDSSNNNPDGFAICKLDMKAFQCRQVANGVYNVKLRIREVW